MEVSLGFGILLLLKKLKVKEGVLAVWVFLFFPISLEAKKVQKDDIAEYWKFMKSFSRDICKGGDHKFKKLYQKYVKNNFNIPLDEDGNPNTEALEEHIPLVLEKNNWLSSLEIKAKRNINRKWRNRLRKKVRDLDKVLASYLNLKEQVRKREISDSEKDKKKELIKKIKEKYANIQENLFVWKNFTDVNYFELRKEYEESKDGVLYFKRKILEDGIPSWQEKDLFFRALLQGLGLRLKEATDDLSRDLVYDLERIIRLAPKFYSKPKKEILRGIRDWQKETSEHLAFFQQIANGKNLDKIKSFKEDRSNLIDFNAKKQEKIYLFWQNKKEIYLYLYALDMILFNEIGSLDDKFSFNRHSVTQLVLNRSKIEKFYQLDPIQALYKQIDRNEGLKDKIGFKKNKWLNILLKKGEFSFTYFFSTLSPKLYCPDRSRRGLRIRQKNLEIALKLWNRPNKEFKATHFFSRRSMLAGIDMTQIWEDLNPINTELGPEIKGRLRKRLSRDFRRRKKEIRYLTTLEAGDNTPYHLYEWKNGKLYLVKSKKGKFYFHYYRDKNTFYYLEQDF